MKINLIPLQQHGDHRGALIALEEKLNIPFEIKRVYFLFATKENVRRGMHAHRTLLQMLIPIQGSCQLILDDGMSRREISLDNPAQAILVESMIWREMYNFSADCVLAVLANSLYDENDYIRNYTEFVGAVNGVNDEN
jgi:dTDP-4-dehydrorhamnose 3,5-epimerase-like enzyme